MGVLTKINKEEKVKVILSTIFKKSKNLIINLTKRVSFGTIMLGVLFLCYFTPAMFLDIIGVLKFVYSAYGFAILTIIVVLVALSINIEVLNVKNVIDKIHKIFEMNNKTFLVILMSVIIPYMSYAIANEFGLGDGLSKNDWFSFLATYFGIIASIGGIYWQVKRNEEKQLIEQENKKNEEMNNIRTYLSHCLEKNVSSEDERALLLFGIPLKFAHILYLKYTDTNKTKKFFYELDKDYISRNIEKILMFHEGKSILEINDEINYLNELIVKNIDYFNIFEIRNEFNILIEQYELNPHEFKGTIINLFELHLSLMNELVFVHGEKFKNSNWNEIIKELKNLYNSKEYLLTNKENFYAFEQYLLEIINQRSDYILDIYAKQLELLYFLLEKLIPGLDLENVERFDLKLLKQKVMAEKLLMNQLKNKVPELIINIIKTKKVLTIIAK